MITRKKGRALIWVMGNFLRQGTLETCCERQRIDQNCEKLFQRNKCVEELWFYSIQGLQFFGDGAFPHRPSAKTGLQGKRMIPHMQRVQEVEEKSSSGALSYMYLVPVLAIYSVRHRIVGLASQAIEIPYEELWSWMIPVSRAHI